MAHFALDTDLAALGLDGQLAKSKPKTRGVNPLGSF